MLLKNLSLITLAIGTSANAAGWVDNVIDNSPGQIYLQGWACDPNQPHATGWVHFTVNNQFISALPANQERADLAQVCGGTTAHGYSGWVSVPDDVAQNASRGNNYKRRDVYVTLVMDNFSPNVEGGRARGVKIWSPTYYDFKYEYWGRCVPDPLWNDSRYAFTKTSMSSIMSCPIQGREPYEILRKAYVDISDPSIPKGAKVNVCHTPEVNDKLIRNGWSISEIFTPSEDCVSSFNSYTAYGKKTYYNVKRYNYLTIIKN